MKSQRTLCALGLLSVALAFAPGFDAEAASAGQKPARPRLALVLSGGGARGAAHLGVLQVLEEMRVPVDMVTGTSMGSVVGGLYAAGLSPDEVSQTIQSVDWVRVFQDKPDRQSLSFRRKQDDRNFLTNLRLAFKDWSIFIPSGVVEGQKLDFLLRSMTLDQSGLAQIEDLPLPFRAVATDIATGEQVIFDHGPLAVAQRASMSVPAAFSPVVVDKRVLVDGYVSNNLPIDVAQDLGAEAVIAVDISTPISKPEELGTAVGIQGQVGTFPVQEQQRRQIERLKKSDVLLQPDLGDVGAASFTRMPEAVEAGRKAALAARDQLARYSVSEEEYAQWRAHQRRPPLQLPVIDAIRVENRSPVSDLVVRARIHTETGKPLDLTVLSEDLARLFGLDAFERVRFDLQREPEGMVLVYQIEARERGRQYVRFGLNLETDIGDKAIYNIGANHVWFPINSWDGELRTEAQIGDTSRIGTELYQPIEPREWLFFQPFTRFERSELDIFRQHDRVATYDRDETITGGLLGVNLGNLAQLRGGIGYLNEEFGRKTGDPFQFRSNQLSGGVYDGEFEYDTLDNVRFPNDGTYANAQGLFFRKEMGFDDSFTRVRGTVSTFRTWRKNTVGLSLRYETTFNGGPHPEAVHSLGGFLNLSGFERNSLTGRHIGLAQALVYRRIASPAVFAWEFPVYVGGMFEIGNAWENRDDIKNDLLTSGGPLVGVDTPLGPLYFAYAHGEGGHDQIYLYLGRTF